MSKYIKKFLIVALVIVSMIILSACDYEYRLYHEYIREETKVINIELINYNNALAQENPFEEYSFDLEKLEILETLDANSINEFLVEIEKIGGLGGKPENMLKSPLGSGIRIGYKDSGFTLITVTVINELNVIFVGHYDADANIERCYGISWQEMIDDFKSLVNDYFIEQIS